MKSRYLREINCEDDYENDERKELFEAEKKEYGFASYDTWNVDITFFEFIYIIFKMYNEKNIIDTHFHHLEINGEQWEMQRAIDYIINSSEKILVSCKKDFLAHEEPSDEFFEVLKKILPIMWW